MLMPGQNEKEAWSSTKRSNYDLIIFLHGYNGLSSVLIFTLSCPPLCKPLDIFQGTFQVEVKEVEQVTFPAQETIDQVTNCQLF